MVDLVRMDAHGSATPPPPEGRIVISRLTAGESRILSLAPALKLVLDGEEVHEIDGRRYVLTPGRFLFVGTGDSYRTLVRGGARTAGMCVYLPGQVQPDAKSIPILGRGIVQAIDGSSLGRMLRQLALQLHSEPTLAPETVLGTSDLSLLLPEALRTAATALQALSAAKMSTRRDVLTRLEYARSHLHAVEDRPVSLQELAGVAGMSAFHLARYFSEAFGAPPARYHRRLRLEHARERLARGGATATQIAFDAGYSQLSAFSHAFRREFGRAPSKIPA